MLSSQQGAILVRLVRINWDVYLKCRIIGSTTGLGRGPENCNLTNAPCYLGSWELQHHMSLRPGPPQPSWLLAETCMDYFVVFLSGTSDPHYFPLSLEDLLIVPSSHLQDLLCFSWFLHDLQASVQLWTHSHSCRRGGGGREHLTHRQLWVMELMCYWSQGMTRKDLVPEDGQENGHRKMVIIEAIHLLSADE